LFEQQLWKMTKKISMYVIKTIAISKKIF